LKKLSLRPHRDYAQTKENLKLHWKKCLLGGKSLPDGAIFELESQNFNIFPNFLEKTFFCKNEACAP